MEDEYGPGFYLIVDNQIVSYAPNCVYGPGFVLRADNPTDHTITVNGWKWYDNIPDKIV